MTGDEQVPANNFGYGLVLLSSPDAARNLCDIFVQTLPNPTVLTHRSPLLVNAYGARAGIAPMIWPVTTWGGSDQPNCPALIRNYNYAGARLLLQRASAEIRARGKTPPDPASPGPFLVTYQTLSHGVKLIDMSRTPVADYQRRFNTAMQLLTTQDGADAEVIRASKHDELRYYVIGSVPAFDVWLHLVLPGHPQLGHP